MKVRKLQFNRDLILFDLFILKYCAILFRKKEEYRIDKTCCQLNDLYRVSFYCQAHKETFFNEKFHVNSFYFSLDE